MTAASPGPWEAKLEQRSMRDGIDVFDAEGDLVFYVPPDDTMELDGGQIVECCSARLRASVRLATAAPELLHALETAYQLHRQNECPTDTSTRDGNWERHAGVECTCGAYEMVRAAIKKARGGQ